MSGLQAVLPADADNVCVMRIRHVVPKQALMMEFFNTMILMLAVAGATDPVNEKKMDSLSLRIGFIVTGLILTMDTYTVAGKNPARAFAPAFLYNNWQEPWLYQVGPFGGATLGALLYRFVFDGHHKHSLHNTLIKHSFSLRNFFKMFCKK